MKKLALIVVVALVFSINAYAHKGGTDSSGGHTDHSTGDYHYHHGQPAHDHYDMDGDGDLDCPYSFEATSKTTDISKPAPTNKMEEPPMIVYLALIALAVTALLLAKRARDLQADIQFQRKEHAQAIDEMNQNHKREMDAAKRRCELELTRLKTRHSEEIDSLLKAKSDSAKKIEKALIDRLGWNYIAELAGTDPNDYYGDDGLMRSKDDSGEEWGEKYTFYEGTGSGKIKYHKKECVHRRQYIIHARYIDHGKYSPCKVCNPTLPNMDWGAKYWALLSEMRYLKQEPAPKDIMINYRDYGGR